MIVSYLTTGNNSSSILKDRNDQSICNDPNAHYPLHRTKRIELYEYIEEISYIA
jgi:hypothetical protein